MIGFDRNAAPGKSAALILGLVWASALLSRPTAAEASLRVVGNAPHARLWLRLYDQLPACWKTERTLAVQELSSDEMARFIARKLGESPGHANGRSVIDACYERGRGRKGDAGAIRILNALDDKKAELIFAHEYAHFIWDEKLNGKQRSCYRCVWCCQQRKGCLVTAYAGESADEGFAEAVAYFLRKPAELRSRDEQSYQYLCGLLGARQAPRKVQPVSQGTSVPRFPG